MIETSIIIPVFGRVDLLTGCLKSVRETVSPGVEVIVSDDGSREAEEVRSVSEEFGARVLRSDQNKGFSVSCNSAIVQAQGEKIVLLNSDTVVLRDWLSPLLKWLDWDSIGLVGNLQFKQDGITVDHLGVFPKKYKGVGGTAFTLQHLYQGVQISEVPDVALRAKIVPAVTGACLAMRRDMRLLFDTRYRNGYEDIDLCYRVRSEHRRQVVIEPDSRILHIGSQSEGRFDHETANRVKFGGDWWEFVDKDPSLQDAVRADRNGEPRPVPPIFSRSRFSL